MSENTTLNAVLALLEGRPELARAYLRDPGSNISSITDLQTRVYKAMDSLREQAVKTALRNLLNMSVRLEAPESMTDSDTIDAYMQGIERVEDLITTVIHKYEDPES